MPRKIFKPTKMQGGNIYRACKGKENIAMIFAAKRASMDNNVNHPKHYTQGGVECIDAIKAATVNKPGIEAVCTANIIKYVWRYESKNGLEDLKKAKWYLECLIAEVERRTIR